MSIWFFFKLAGSLALLMYGMKSMSESLQKMAGSQLRHVLQAMTANRFAGMLTGAFVTASVQSSTATTVMTVSFVNAGLITLAQAISIIMGANIGTTLTAWVMSAGFSFNITDFVWPAFFLAIILIYSKKRKSIGDFLFGISFLLLGLGTLKETGAEMHLENIPAVMHFFEAFDDNYLSYFLFLLIGGILTVCVQSSAAVMAITMTLCSTGVLPIYLGIALVMGENIGTTVTSNVAAITANIQARRAAFAHMFFNVFGVIWVLCIFRTFVNAICNLVGYPTEGATIADAGKLPFVLAAFHTMFNVINTLVLIWFIPQIEKLVCRVITKSKGEEEDDFKLNFISTGLMQTPELSVLEAEKEIRSFAKRIQKMFSFVRELLDEKDVTEFAKKFSRIEKYESISDRIELEIAEYLNNVSSERLSDYTKAKVRAMLREISEIESIGDSCYNVARTINRKQQSKEVFTEEQHSHICQMMMLADSSLTEMNNMLKEHRDTNAFNKVMNIETEINNFRNQLKNQNINDINEHKYAYGIGTIYMDIITECEKLGDYVVNVAEARLGIRVK
ncbi:Na/Pi cotransporter family protein [Palleniella muris]|uniref:Na/Pi cotransporter family protein n=1 Tax=Palleniella muris TaxID=3038145 RepID=A0AC61QQV8_9BACT|nr:Na/Pi cotransporter family protein [Palleniella muris]TGX82654.1 Na/Pi cotransporter family protein [Palleniella muris]